MKRIYILCIFCLMATSIFAQSINQSSERVERVANDTTTFKGYLYNKEYNVYIQMDFYHNNIIVPNQEVYGEMSGYFGDKQDARKWLFTDAKITSPTTASISIINDYGSEDLIATLTQKGNNIYILKQQEGSIIKIARNHKWVKMPKTMEFVKQK